MAQAFELGLQFPALGVQFPHSFKLLFDACELVQQVELGLARKQCHVFVLAMHLHQQPGQRLHRRQSNGLIIHQHAALSTRLDFPPQDDFGFVTSSQAVFFQPV